MRRRGRLPAKGYQFGCIRLSNYRRLYLWRLVDRVHNRYSLCFHHSSGKRPLDSNDRRDRAETQFRGTLERAVQRTIGTVLGALVAAVLQLVLTNPWLLLSALAILAFATFALRNRSYALFSLSLTQMVMLMLDIAHPISVTDSFLRILHTITGSFLALLSGYLLFRRGRAAASASYSRSASNR